jgi:hypothetical protein
MKTKERFHFCACFCHRKLPQNGRKIVYRHTHNKRALSVKNISVRLFDYAIVHSHRSELEKEEKRAITLRV